MQAYVKTWYKPGELIRIWHKVPEGEDKRFQRFHTMTYEQLLELPADEFFDWSLQGHNLYFMVNPHSEDLGDNNWKRGGKSVVKTLRGLYLDLDIGKGFETQADMARFIKSLPFMPAMIVDSGSGGLHVYHRFSRDVDPDNTEIFERWLALCNGVAHYELDSVTVDSARCLRMPGTFRNDKGIKGAVKLLMCSDAVVDPDEVIRLSQPYYKAVQEQAEVKRVVTQERKVRQDNIIRTQGVEPDDLDDWCNSWEWEDILEGWTKYGLPDSEGRQSWTRPHDPGEAVNPKSAQTDWEENPNVMTLKSTSPTTGLHEVDGPLSKMQCLLTLRYDNDPWALVMDFMEHNNG